jgi:hypothetical protein
VKFVGELMPFEAVIFNSITSTILKRLMFEFQIFSIVYQWFWIGNQGIILPKAVKFY